MSTLSGNTISSSYPSLLRYDNFTGNTSSTDLIGIVDGLGNRTPLSLAGSKFSVRDNVDFTLATEVDFDGTTLKIAGSDMDFTTTNTTGITKNFAVKDAGGRQQPIDGQINFSASTGINITEDVGTGTFTWSATGGNIIKVGTGITTTEGKAVYWNGTEWSTSPTSVNAYDKLIGITNGTNTLTDGVIIGGLVTKTAQTGYTAGDLYLPDTAGGFETNKNNILSPGYIRGVGHSLGSVGIVLNPDIFYSASTNVAPTPTPSVTPSPTPSVTPTPTPIPFDSDAAAYLADVIASGGTTNATISGATDTLFKDLKSAGLYSKLDLFYPFVGGTAASHAINALRNKTYDISWNGGMTHGVSGSTGNGSNGWGDLTFAIDDLTTRTLGSWGLYITDANSASNNGLHGNFDADRTTIAPYRATSTVNRYNFMYSPSPGISQPTNIDGNHTVVRTGTTEFAVYVNETQHATASGYNTSSATNLMSLFVFTANGSPTAGTYRDDTLGFCYFGSDIDYSETITLQGIINDFQTALGRNTYT